MGMFDSLIMECPQCGAELELQSKSGQCMLDRYTKDDLSPYVAAGLVGDVVSCAYCNNNWEFDCELPGKVTNIELRKTKKVRRYPGNFK